MPSPGPAGVPYKITATVPLTPATTPVYVDADEVADAAMASGRIGPGEERDHWTHEIRAGGRAGADSIMSLLELPDSETTYQALYPDSPPPHPPTEPDWMGMSDARNAWLTSVQAGGPADHEIINHEPLTVSEHEHAHSNYSGSTHTHPHAHFGTADHSPFSEGHAHQPLASASPVTRGIAARAAATGAGDLTPDQILQRLGYRDS